MPYINIKPSNLILSIIIIIMTVYLPLFSQEPADPNANQETKENAKDFAKLMEDGMNEIDFYSLEELLDVEVEVASLFAEDELVVGSTVSSITPQQWKKRGARRMTDTLENETSIITAVTHGGYYATAIRGYTRDAHSTRGVVYMIDGIPILSLTNSMNETSLPNMGLGTLNRIEIIKGPGSAIYGSDAFHGVISMKTFESDKDHYSIEAAGAYPAYTDSSVNISQGFGSAIRVNAAAGYNQQIESLDLEYRYDTADTTSIIPLSLLTQPAAVGTGEYENKYRTATGILKLHFKTTEKFEINLNGYIINNYMENFPGVKEAIFISVNDRDQSSQNTTLYMGKGSAVYTMANKISIEAKGYYWQNKGTEDANITSDGKYAHYWFNEQRTGADIIIKQPDNPVNLQWLAAYSIMNAKVLNVEMETRYEDGAPWTAYGDLMPARTKQGSNGMERTINSVYAQAKWGVLKNRLFLLLGGRLDNYSDWGTQLTPRGGIIFMPTEKSSAKALYGRAFRAPCGITVRGLQGYNPPSPDINPETIDIYELIFMYKEKKWKATINGFYSYWQDGIILEYSPNVLLEYYTGGEYVNSGKNRAYGGEINLFYSIDPFALDLGFSYVKSEALDLALSVDPGNPLEARKIIRDVEYGAFPEYIIIFGLHYNLKPFDLNFFLNNRIYLMMKETPDPFEKDDLPTYWRTDLNISKIISKKLELFLDIKNLLNRSNYMPSLYYSKLSDETGIPEPGISVLLRAGYKL